jgi:glycosyltransferase involved in cell wall biosynthesis
VSAAPKQRILLVLPGAFGPTGGIEMYNRLLIKAFHEIALERRGTCETLLLLDDDGRYDDRYFSAGLSLPRSFSGSRPRFAAAILERAARLGPNLIVFGHVNFASVALATRAIRPTSEQWFITHGIEVWRRMSPQQRLAVGTAEHILSVSDYTREQLVRHNGIRRGRVGLQPCALDPFWADDFARLREPAVAGTRVDPARPMLMTVARLADTERYKGIDQVIRALPALAKAIPGIRYAIVGTGTDRARLEQVARECGVAERVEFRGRVSSEALAAAYAESALFVMPSAKEGFGIVFLEAALFNKASIGGNHGGTPEVIADGVTGRLVTYDDVPGFARVCAEMLADPEALAVMGRRARARLDERFTDATLVQTLRQLVGRQLDG